MFDTPDIARHHLAEQFRPAQIDMLVGALEPSIQFIPAGKGAVTPGGSRIGGTPDLPGAMAWPVPDYPANIAEITSRGSAEANEELKQHVALGLPYAFFAQVNLPEAKALGQVASHLPDDGRLLFFYDLVAGAYDTGVWTVRVIWDRTPVNKLEPRALPPALQNASQERRASDEAFDKQMRKEYGDDAVQRAPDAGTPYDGPARAMRLTTTLRPPAKEAIEVNRYPILKAELTKARVNYEEAFSDHYGELFSKRFDSYYGPANRGNRNQLLGTPLPEQSDPRHDAVVAADKDGRFASDAGQKHAADSDARAHDWTLLLQIDVADWMQDDGEGTVYFLIRADDLMNRRFDRVIGVYQQT